ncbi:MAG: (Fe-S)-binding protein [Acidimicrobiia bacterium]
MAWITDHPPTSADLDSCITCGLCLPACPTFRLTGDETASPRGRLTAIAAVAAGEIEVDERFDAVTDFCLQCRACETVCPSMVPYGRIIESARSEVVAQRPTPSSRVRGFALGRLIAQRGLMRMVTLGMAIAQRLHLLQLVPRLGSASSGLRRLSLPVQSAHGGRWGPEDAPSVVLFTGCVADAWFTDVHAATIELLVRAGYRVEAPPAQTCCGSLAAHSGHGDEARRLARTNIAALADAERIVVDVAGCGAHLKSYEHQDPKGDVLANKVSDVTEIIAEAIADGRLPALSPNGTSVAVADPCHLEHGQQVTDQPRTILKAAGLSPIDADPGGLCCGAAGLYQVSYPETSEELGQRKAQSVVDTGAKLVASANAGCEMQLRRFLDAGFTVRHPVEIYAEALRLADGQPSRSVG